MKKNKLFAVALFVLAFSVFCTSVMSTISKYVTNVDAYFGDDKEIDYTVSSVFEVKTQDELFAAINQGYSYIQISKDVENPLIVTKAAENLDADLILDLNGIEIQRNGSDPILNVGKGVRLTVTDTSEEQTGGLYNPIGSVFHINDGGILTVVTGLFESGPRYSEYYSYNTNILANDNNVTKRTLVEEEGQAVQFYLNGHLVNSSYVAPIIKSYPTATGDIIYNHGNLYFDEDVTKGHTIYADTYCYYRTSEDSVVSTPDPATASWYYTYYVTKDTYDYVGATITGEEIASEEYIQVTIYGYEDVIETAKNITDYEKYFAAIQMQGGTLEVQEGGFYSYFGVDTTACVNASGGEIKIGEGYFSSRIPNATGRETVSVKEDDSKAFDDDYFNDFIWNTADTRGSQASAGESYCILNHGTDTVVSINKGSFYSINNNIVCMSDGKLSIGGGSFKKQYLGNTPMASAVTALADKTAAIYMQNGSLDVTGTSTCTVNGDYSQGIYMQNGELNVSGAKYYITGKSARGINMLNGVLSVDLSSYTVNGAAARGINMANGKLTVSNSSYTVTGSNVYGIYSTVSGDDNFIVNNTSFTLDGGDTQVGIYAENGRVSLKADSSASISVSGNNSKGVQVNGGSVISENCNYTLNGNNSYGIYAENGTVTASATASATISLGGASSMGVYVDAGTVTSENYNYSLLGDNSYGIYVLNGEVMASASTQASMTLGGASSMGIRVNGGTVTSQNYNFTLDGTDSTGIYAENGTVKVSSTSSASITMHSERSKGIYVNGASVTSTNYSYKLGGAASMGIHSAGGTVSVSGGDITLDSNETCYGVYAATTNNSSELSVTVDSATISVGYNSDNNKSSGTHASSIGVFLASLNPEHAVILKGTNIYSYEVGVALSGGKLDISGEGRIETKRASAIAVNGGNLTFGETSKYTVVSHNTTSTASSNVYTLTLPALSGGALVTQSYANTDGIYVDGGKFDSKGNLTLTHTGLYNATNYNDYTGLVVTSYAIRVNGGDVSVVKGSITAEVGGGIHCAGGSITMGTVASTLSDITVKTNGEYARGTLYAIGTANGGWQSKYSITGGHAIELTGGDGDIVIYNGTYEADFGNGVAANGKGSITIHNGIFNGWMGKDSGDHADLVGKSGPSAFYGLKVIGGATVNIHGGTFDGGNGGAFITGIDNYKNKTGSYANVYIYSGTFGHKGTSLLDGFNIYDMANVIFGASPEGTYTSADDYMNAIRIYSQNATIAVNVLTGSEKSKAPTVEIYYGDYTEGASGIFNENSNTTVIAYNIEPGYTNVTKGAFEDYKNKDAIYYVP